MRKNAIILYLAATTVLLNISACNNSATTSNTAQANGAAASSTNNDRKTSTGEELFQQRCIACHGSAGNYRNNNAANLQVSVLDSISIINTIRNGKGAMPMFGRVMPDSDLAQVEIYVRSLRKH